MPVRGLLVSVPDPQHGRLVKRPAGDLQAMGRLARVNPHGTDSAGSRVMLKGNV